MEEVSDTKEWGENALFNSLTEIGMRILFILDAFYPLALDLKNLSIYDYYVIHTEDVGGPKSLHVPTKSRAGEFLVRRKGIQNALIFLQKTHLIELKQDTNGQTYKITDEATGLLDVASTAYHEKLKHRAAWLYGRHISENTQFEALMLRRLSDELEIVDHN